MPHPPKANSSAPSPSDLSWLKHAQADQQKAPERLEETAKYLSGIVSIALTIFISNQAKEVVGAAENWLVGAVLLWMLAVVLSMFVLFPWRYSFVSDAPQSIQDAYSRVVKTKRLLLIISMIAFLIGLGSAVWGFSYAA
jgi:hypothetical protein